MAYLVINQDKVTRENGDALKALCPFGAIGEESGLLTISAGCRMCRLCVNKGPEGVVCWVEEETQGTNKELWRGIAVYGEQSEGSLHPVTLELLGKARELAAVTAHPVYCILLGREVAGLASSLLEHGADKVFVYDHPGLEDFHILAYANVFADFIEKVKPSSVLVGATNAGRSLAPRVAARFRTGLTADCTVLQMKENTDLVQIRPAFGGNIMAQIVTPSHRPQFCTVRYKIFNRAEKVDNPTGRTEIMEVREEFFDQRIRIIDKIRKEKETDISEAELIVAAGRGVKNPGDLELLRELAELLGARLACTRPLIEKGWFDARRQIGLSGRTVKPKLIITAGISGSVQFAAGMKGSDCIIAINNDRGAPIFDIAHYGLVGDLYEIVPRLIREIREGE